MIQVSLSHQTGIVKMITCLQIEIPLFTNGKIKISFQCVNLYRVDMASNCYNTFSFFGNKKVAQQIEAWASSLKEVAEGKSSLQSEETIFEVFFPGADLKNAIGYLGSKWAYPDFGESIALETGELGFVSAWSSMDSFQDHLTEELSKLDKNVVVLLSSSADSYDEVARYTATKDDGEIFSQIAHLECDEDEDEEDPDPNYTLFYEHQIDACSELIDEVPGAEPRLKKHLKRLEKAFEESL